MTKNRESVLFYLLSPIKQYFVRASFKARWRAENQHNRTEAKNVFPIEKVRVGYGTYGDLYVLAFNEGDEGLTIGSYCSIAGDVRFLLGGEHPINRLSTFPIARHELGIDEKSLDATKGPITIEDDVWICDGVTVLSGVTIGRGAIVGAGSIVAKDIPPYAIFAGGRVLKYRFPEDVIEKLCGIEDWSFDPSADRTAAMTACTELITSENVDAVVSVINSLPRRAE